MMNIIEAMHDHRLFYETLKGGREIWPWGAWETYLSALFGLPIKNPAELELFRACTGLESPAADPARESFVIAGRRSGKSTIAALLAVFIAGFRDWRKILSPGEKGHVFVIAVDKAQAGIVKGYCRAFLEGSPSLRKLLKRETAETLELSNGVTIMVKTSSFRSVRGYTLLAVVLEELSFWRSDESANPDKETLAAVRPALMTVKGSLLIGISSPYSKAGALYEAFKGGYGQAGGPLIWRAASTLMNPELDGRLVAAALEDDPAAARSEWLAEFRQDIEAFIPVELVESVMIPGRLELPRIDGVQYRAFADPSGGRNDSFTLAIGHAEAKTGRVIVDVIRERRPPFSPADVVAEFAETLQSFGVVKVLGDRYSGEWVAEAFKKCGILYAPAEKSASELYLDFLPMLMNGSIELLDSRRLKAQLVDLERRTRSGGRDIIDHGPAGHDDVAVVCAGLCVTIGRSKRRGGFVYYSGSASLAGSLAVPAAGGSPAEVKPGEIPPMSTAAGQAEAAAVKPARPFKRRIFFPAGRHQSISPDELKGAFDRLTRRGDDKP
jgi:hypothetical protein